MMHDPYTTTYLAKVHVQEMREQAQKAHLLKQIAASNGSFAEYLITIVSGWMQRMKPMVEPKRSTAEIPSL